MRKAPRVVRYVARDGTTREYRYVPYHPAPKPELPTDTIQALVNAYCRSPKWLSLSQATRDTYIIYLRALERVGHTRVAAMSRRDLLTIRDAIAVSRGSGAAVGFARATSALFAWAEKREWIKATPATRLTEELQGGHLPAWTQDQAELAIANLAEPLRRVVLLALYTGQRRVDLATMRWSAYVGDEIAVRQIKTGEELTIPTHPRLKGELDAWDRAAQTILTDQNGRPWKAANISHRLPYALAAIEGMPAGLNIHGLRKLAAANLAEAGCSTKEIASITGHQTLAMVELYTKSADQKRLARAAIDRLQNSDKTKTK